MRVVLDTNIVVSGLLWSGTPHHILQLVKAHRIQALASEAMVDELTDVLARDKFSPKLQKLNQSAEQIVQDYIANVTIIDVEPLPTPMSSDPDDDMFIACAVTGGASVIVSGDPHLLTLERVQQIPIQSASVFWGRFNTDK